MTRASMNSAPYTTRSSNRYLTFPALCNSRSNVRHTFLLASDGEVPSTQVVLQLYFWDYIPLVNVTANDACKRTSSVNLSGKLLLVRQGSNCTYDTVVSNFKAEHPAGILISTPRAKVANLEFDTSTIQGSNMIVGFISETSVEALVALIKPNSNTMAKMSTQEGLEFDLSLVIIWCLAVFTVAVGSYWSGIVKLELYQHEIGKCTNPAHMVPVVVASKEAPPPPANERQDKPDEEESAMDVTPGSIVLFVITMGGMLMMLYFFFQYLVYFIIVMFALASVVSVIGVLEPVIYMIPIGTSPLPNGICPCFYGPLEVRQGVLIAFAVLVSGTWVVFRHHPLAWVLQDMLGVAFSINMLKTLRLPSFMIITVLLTMLFFYDIFFVFVTPYLTVKGESIMVEVAKGSGSPEKLPVVLKVPHLNNQAISVCLGKFSLLGYGDMLVPGLLVSYCHGFDLIFAQGYCYYAISIFSYGMGLVATFGGLYIMKMAQPALLYLVPATVVPILCLAWYRGHLGELWHGHTPSDVSGSNSDTPPGSEPDDRKSPKRKSSGPKDRYPKQPQFVGDPRQIPAFHQAQNMRPQYANPAYEAPMYAMHPVPPPPPPQWGNQRWNRIPHGEQKAVYTASVIPLHEDDEAYQPMLRGHKKSIPDYDRLFLGDEEKMQDIGLRESQERHRTERSFSPSGDRGEALVVIKESTVKRRTAHEPLIEGSVERERNDELLIVETT
ncbi:signal peptide peptidase-like 2A isoform X2 [Ornithodoros turicata]|uniref:signal peptide peptidase-like 2A isoform X2 n=1 Tax=Ornithodoros turicata TaxID=34597 RepID=UPI0031391F98